MKLFKRNFVVGTYPVALAMGLAFAVACGGASTTGVVDGTGSGTDGGDGTDGASGSGDDGGGTGGPDTDAAPVCTSGKTWTHGTSGSSMMQPGAACITCHSTSGGGAPSFYVAGTVYPTYHEPDECNGAAGIQVVVTDANGKSFTLTTNSVGNFACGESAHSGFPACAGFKTPLSAKVVNPKTGKTGVMIDPRDTGDCNSCHTQNGLMSAPGRIVVP